MVVSAEELYRRGLVFTNTGRYAAARRALASAARRTSDPNLRARVSGTEAFVLARIGDPEAAERLCREALAEPELTGETKAILQGQLGALAMNSGRLDEAEAWLSRGIAGLADDGLASANLRMNRALVNMQRRELAAAASDIEVALEVYTRENLESDQAQAAHNLGYVALLRGDLVEALRAMGQARVLLATESAASKAIGDLDRAEVLRDAGLSRDAEQILEGVARVFGAQGMRQARAEAELSLARSLLTHDPVAAHRVAGSAARRFRALGSETWAARADGVRVRAGLARGVVDPQGRAMPAVRRAPTDSEVTATAVELEHHGLRSEAAAVRLAGELRRARQGRVEPVHVVREPKNAPIDVRLLAHEVRAARAAASGREREVRRHAARGIEALSEWQHSFGSIDLRTSVTAYGLPLLMAGLDSAIRSRHPEVIFEWSEQARHIAQQVVPLRPPPDSELAAELSELRMIRADHEGSDWLDDPRAAVLRDRARERQWTRTGAAGTEERVALAQARTALDADTAFLAYVWSASGMACVVVTGSSSRVFDIDWPTIRRAMGGLRADLDVSASVRRGAMADVVRRTLDARLALISDTLLRAPAEAAGTRRLVITAPGVLSGIPWSMMPASRGRALTLPVSASRWVAHRNPVAPPSTAGIAVGPMVERGDEEADAAASAWPAAGVLRGREATVDAVADLASVVDVLHVAAHGRHAAENPLFSGLELADGALFGYDIDRMPRVPATVVLSSCELGRSSVRWGEEALGMTRTWLHAGSRCVIAAPVIVADDAACELLGAVHVGLAAGVAPAEALAAASEATGIVAPFQCHGSGF